MFTLEHYLTETERNPFADWYYGLKDPIAKRAIDRRLSRLVMGNFGNHNPCGDGVWELRIDTGQGYRVYYAQVGQTLILLRQAHAASRY